MDECSMDSEVQVLVCEQCSAAFLSEEGFKLHACIKRIVTSSSEKSRESSFEKRVHYESGYFDNDSDDDMSDRLVINESEPSGSSLDVAPSGPSGSSLDVALSEPSGSSLDVAPFGPSGSSLVVAPSGPSGSSLDVALSEPSGSSLDVAPSGPSGSSLDVAPSGSELKSLEQKFQKADVGKMHLSNPGQANCIAEISKRCIQKHIVLNSSDLENNPVSSQKMLTCIKPITGFPKVFIFPLRPNVPVHNIQSLTSNRSVGPMPQVLRLNNQRPVNPVSGTVSQNNSSKLPTRIVKFDLTRPACNTINNVTHNFLNGQPQLTSHTCRINNGRIAKIVPIVKIVPKGMLKSVNRLISFQRNNSSALNESVVVPQMSSDVQSRFPENTEASNGEQVNEKLTSKETDISHHVKHVANTKLNKSETKMQDDDFLKQLIIDEYPVSESNPEVSFSYDPNQTHQESNSKERRVNNNMKGILSPKHMATEEDPNQKTDMSISRENLVPLSKRLTCTNSESAILKQEIISKEIEVPILEKQTVTNKPVKNVIQIIVKSVGNNSGVVHLLKDPSIKRYITEHVKTIQKGKTDQKPICISIQTSGAIANRLQKSKAKSVRLFKRQPVSENINQSISQNDIVQERNAVSNNQSVTRYEPTSAAPSNHVQKSKAKVVQLHKKQVVAKIMNQPIYRNNRVKKRHAVLNEQPVSRYEARFETEKADSRLIDNVSSRLESVPRILRNTDIEDIHTAVDASYDRGNRETGIDVKPYVCTTCSMVMDSEWELEAHRTSCKGDKCVEVKFEVEGFQCSVCSERFSDEATFDEHLEICSEAVYNTSRMADIPTEFLNIANNNLPYCVGDPSGNKTMYACGMCGKEFHERWFLSRHMKVHSQEKDFICTICGQAFTYKHNLKNHMGFHGDHRPYKCEVCDATFKYPNNLSKHKKIHKPDDVVKKFKCRYCNRGFKENYHRERHEASHAPQRTIECQHCDLTFSRRDNLQQHMKRIHSLDARAKVVKRKCRRQPWSCLLCGQKFLWRKYFITHMEMLHPGVETPEFQQARLGVRDKCDGSDNDNGGDVDDDDVGDIGKEDYNSESDDDNVELDSEDDDKAIKNVQQCVKLTCSKCDRVFRSEGNLQRHMRFMHDQN
ncbi:uncharacterized protein LOC127859023 [Dreissena polymorpha]|uniref:uncharacterized protein LOC127859023 n=1 Tax=Dreissena polymorpha TaxID=45954 RepID=UPI00226417DA|nr:uncharacterized protein LOC127859023 [Dreissena polymorpha]XP_052252367.1 uncharacterized protein LOC127859023 [Dreissena polymorpha]XP_052252368.1 uncharacterized protein LOC127859023 [Dreissena polymorpha]